jgi:hypothetical protein
MTNPDELERAVERLEADVSANHAMTLGGAVVRVSDIRLILSANREMREALEFITEAHDAGRHDGLPEDCPAHDADTMFAVARSALTTQRGDGE